MMLVVAAGRRGQRRTGSQVDDSEYGSARPSAPATLFDFVTSKMSQSSSSGTLPFSYFWSTVKYVSCSYKTLEMIVSR